MHALAYYRTPYQYYMFSCGAHKHTHTYTCTCTLESEWQALPVQSFQANDYHCGTNAGNLTLSTADTFTYKTRETHNTVLIHACHNYPWYDTTYTCAHTHTLYSGVCVCMALQYFEQCKHLSTLTIHAYILHSVCSHYMYA